MSDEKSDAVSQREVRFALAALFMPASKAEQYARRVRLVWPTQVVVAFLPALVNFGLATYGLWLIFAGQSANWQDFWTRTIATLAWTAFALIALGLVIRGRLFPTALVLQVHQGTQALRQIAASGDGKLTPIPATVTWTNSDSESMDPMTLGPLHRLERQRARRFLILSLVLIICGAILVVPALAPQATSVDRAEYLSTSAAALIVGLFALARVFPWLRSFTISSDEQEFRWPLPAFGPWRRRVQTPWQDTQAFVTFRASKDGKNSAADEVFLLDTTAEALAWRITPRTPASVREAHERFVRMANQHAPLRDITASLKDLLDSPETRSYEYAVTALSGSAPVPPAVRKALTTPVRESHFLHGYLIVAAILLALLVTTGLLLQFGLIPAGSF